MTSTDLTIRLASDRDAEALTRLAALDSRNRVPAGPHLVAEIDGRIHAAHSLSGAGSIADPFVHTADLLTLLEARASRLQPAPRRLIGRRRIAVVPAGH